MGKKTYTIFAGVNGAGKSTLYQSYFMKQNEIRINPDEIVQSFGDWRNTIDQMKAGKIAVKMINDAIQKGMSFNQETTLSGKAVFNTIKKAKAAGYVINVYYVGLESSNLAKERVKQRVLKGGHDIPSELIEKRYQESLDNLKKIIPLCDGQSICDNTKEFKFVAEISHGMILWNDKECKWLNPIIELYRKEKIEEIIRKAGYKPTDKLIMNMKNINAAFNKFHTVEDVRALYHQCESLDSYKKELVCDMANEFIKEEKKELRKENVKIHQKQPEM